MLIELLIVQALRGISQTSVYLTIDRDSKTIVKFLVLVEITRSVLFMLNTHCFLAVTSDVHESFAHPTKRMTDDSHWERGVLAQSFSQELC